MTIQRTWLWIGGVIAVAAAALALGEISLQTLVLLTLVLVCPVAMYFMMRGMGGRRESGHVDTGGQTDIPEPRRTPKEDERQTTHLSA